MLQADAFAGYAELYRAGTIQEVASMAHARRHIHDLHAVRPNAVTEEALRRIGALYTIEEQIRGKPPEERLSVRRARAVPLLDDMKRWFEATLATLSVKSDTTQGDSVRAESLASAHLLLQRRARRNRQPDRGASPARRRPRQTELLVRRRRLRWRTCCRDV